MKKYLKFLSLVQCVFLLLSCNGDKTETTQDTPREPQYFSVSFVENDCVYFRTDQEQENILEGSSFTFKIFKRDTNIFNFVSMKVKANDNVLTSNSSTYVVNNIRSDISISVEDVVRNKVNINFSQHEGVTYTHEGQTIKENIFEADKGLDFKFRVNKNEPEWFDYSETKVLIDGDEKTTITDIYTISNVMEEHSVDVQGLIEKFYHVNLEDELTFKLVGNKRVIKGESYEFDIEAISSYIEKDSIVITVNNQDITKTNGKYHIDQVNEDLTIKIKSFTSNDPLETDTDGDNIVEDF